MSTQSNQIPIAFELKKLGLSKKEADVYLACLDLRQASVQNIAHLVKLSRPTTYRLIESLLKKDLVKKIDRNKKTLIVAESPDEILGLLRSKKRRIEEQEREFLRIISELKNRFNFNGQNEIKTFKGEAGIKYILDDFSTTPISSVDIIYFKKGFLKKEIDKVLRSIQKRLGKFKKKELEFESKNNSTVIIITDKLYCLKNSKSFFIENKDLIYLVKSLVNLVRLKMTHLSIQNPDLI